MARKALQPRADREIFVVPLEVRAEHIDANGHVNNVVYVGWLQEAGTAHWNEIDYQRGIGPDATGVVARTWVGDPEGPRFNRYVRIEDGEGRLCAQGVSEWCLVDARSLRPHRIPADLVARFGR